MPETIAPRHRKTENEEIERAGGRRGGATGQTCQLPLGIVHATRPPACISRTVQCPLVAEIPVILGGMPQKYPALHSSDRALVFIGCVHFHQASRSTIHVVPCLIICAARASTYETLRIIARFCSNGLNVSISRYTARSVHLRKFSQGFGCMPGEQEPAIPRAHPAYVPRRWCAGGEGGCAEM